MIKDIHDISPPIEIDFNYLPIIILFVVLVSILLLLLYLTLRRKKTKKETSVLTVVKSNLSAKENALQKINDLKKQGLIEEQRYELFYNKLSDILKTYLYEKYAFEFEAKTSSEIINELKKINLSYDFIRQLELCLKDLDYIKFANIKANKFEMENSIDLILSLLKLE